MNNIKQILKIEPGGEQKNHIKETTKKAWQQLTNENKISFDMSNIVSIFVYQ